MRDVYIVQSPAKCLDKDQNSKYNIEQKWHVCGLDFNIENIRKIDYNPFLYAALYGGLGSIIVGVANNLSPDFLSFPKSFILASISRGYSSPFAKRLPGDVFFNKEQILANKYLIERNDNNLYLLQNPGECANGDLVVKEFRYGAQLLEWTISRISGEVMYS